LVFDKRRLIKRRVRVVFSLVVVLANTSNIGNPD
jgi:hypothetical protein